MNNLTLTAMLAALLSASQAVSFLLRDYENRLFRSFAVFCSVVCIANLSLALAIVEDSRIWHVIHMVSAILSAPASVFFFIKLLGKPQPRGSSLRPLLVPLAVALSLLVIVTYNPFEYSSISFLPFEYSSFLKKFSDLKNNTITIPINSIFSLEKISQLLSTKHWVSYLVGIYVFGTYTFILLNIREKKRNTTSRIERGRLRLFLLLGAFTWICIALQAIAPYIELPGGRYPIGGLAQIVLISFLSQVMLLHRLLDLHESMSRGLVFVVQALTISGLYSFLLWFFGDRKDWVNLVITIFLASGVASLLYEPIKKFIETFIKRIFFFKQHEVLLHLNVVEQLLPKILSVEELFDVLVKQLQETTRMTHIGVFLWDHQRHQYGCIRKVGNGDWPFIKYISSNSPLVKELLLQHRPIEQELWHKTIELPSETRADTLSALQMLKNMDADVAVPFISEGLLYGFLILKEGFLQEGFLHDELETLERIAQKASVLIQNIDAIKRIKEHDRLTALGQMAAGLAHEIRNPLGAIRGAAEYLSEEVLPETDKEFLAIIVEEVDRLNVVVTEFLDYARPLKINKQPTDIKKIVYYIQQVLLAQGIPDFITLNIDIDDNLPEIPIDVEKLKQVLLNLSQNALQAMATSGILSIEVKKVEKEIIATGIRHPSSFSTWLEISVLDTGVGIPTDEIEKLFIPFYTTKNGGTGLGLAISQRLVQAMSGIIQVKSEIGKGSCFSVFLPIPIASL